MKLGGFLITLKVYALYKNMDERREKIKKYIEDSDVPGNLKVKELEIVNNMNLSTPEVEIALAKLIGEEFDTKIASAGITDIPHDKEVDEAFKKFDLESKKAEEDLENDMKIVNDNLKTIQETSEEIQKIAIQESLANKE